MRPPTEFNIRRCELSVAKHCECRCEGEMHGAGRDDGSLTFYLELPEDDPHYVNTAKQLPLPNRYLPSEVQS